MGADGTNESSSAAPWAIAFGYGRPGFSLEVEIVSSCLIFSFYAGCRVGEVLAAKGNTFCCLLTSWAPTRLPTLGSSAQNPGDVELEFSTLLSTRQCLSHCLKLFGGRWGAVLCSTVPVLVHIAPGGTPCSRGLKSHWVPKSHLVRCELAAQFSCTSEALVFQTWCGGYGFSTRKP